VTVPKIEGRYYTVQFLDGWGETLANINERIFPDKPYGEFAVCYKGRNVAIPEDARRIDLPTKYCRVKTVNAPTTFTISTMSVPTPGS
jgi:hypothetical protein